MRLLRKARTFLFLASRNPAKTWDLVQLRLEARLGRPLPGLSRRRRMTRRFELARTKPLSPALKRYGNYVLDPRRIGSAPIVFSVGVGDDIDFDLAMLEVEGARLFLFDPTPRSEHFVKAAALPDQVSFQRLAVAAHDGTITLYIDDLEGDLDSTSSVSVNNLGFAGSGFDVSCRRVTTLMAEAGVDRLDVLKLDIEGAAIQVLDDVLDSGVLPGQIAVEFERPVKLADVRVYLTELDRLFRKLEGKGYTLYRTRPNDEGFQVEILAVLGGNTAGALPEAAAGAEAA